jgi:hypothetical protein
MVNKCRRGVSPRAINYLYGSVTQQDAASTLQNFFAKCKEVTEIEFILCSILLC